MGDLGSLLSGENVKYLLLPFISAFIGWMTNWIAIKMLFHPKKPISFFFFTLHGIFYKKQTLLAHKLATTIEAKLFSHGDIYQVLKSEKFKQGIFHVVETYIDDFIDNRLTTIHPMLAMLPKDIILSIKKKLLDEFENFTPHLIEYVEKGFDSHLNIRELIRKKIESFEVEQLEEILQAILKSEFRVLEYVGGILGFLIGITQLLLVRFL